MMSTVLVDIESDSLVIVEVAEEAPATMVVAKNKYVRNYLS